MIDIRKIDEKLENTMKNICVYGGAALAGIFVPIIGTTIMVGRAGYQLADRSESQDAFDGGVGGAILGLILGGIAHLTIPHYDNDRINVGSDSNVVLSYDSTAGAHAFPFIKRNDKQLSKVKLSLDNGVMCNYNVDSDRVDSSFDYANVDGSLEVLGPKSVSNLTNALNYSGGVREGGEIDRLKNNYERSCNSTLISYLRVNSALRNEILNEYR